jgi:hypothetical protein
MLGTQMLINFSLLSLIFFSLAIGISTRMAISQMNPQDHKFFRRLGVFCLSIAVGALVFALADLAFGVYFLLHRSFS